MGKHKKGPEQRGRGAEQRQQAAGQNQSQNREAGRQHEVGAHDKGAQHARQHGQEAGKQRTDEHNR
jgi:hypothetical protein